MSVFAKYNIIMHVAAFKCVVCVCMSVTVCVCVCVCVYVCVCVSLWLDSDHFLYLYSMLWLHYVTNESYKVNRF